MFDSFKSFIGRLSYGSAKALDNQIKHGKSEVCPRTGDYLNDAGGIITTACVAAVAVGIGVVSVIELFRGSKPSTNDGKNYSGQQRRRTRR